MGSESDCLFGQLDRILWTSDSDAGVKKEAKLSASEVPGEVVGSGEEDLRCRSLLTVFQRRLGLSEADVRGWNSTLFGRQDELVVLVAERLERVPVSSRVSEFPNVFSMAEGGSKCTEGSRKRRV